MRIPSYIWLAMDTIYNIAITLWLLHCTYSYCTKLIAVTSNMVTVNDCNHIPWSEPVSDYDHIVIRAIIPHIVYIPYLMLWQLVCNNIVIIVTHRLWVTSYNHIVIGAITPYIVFKPYLMSQQLVWYVILDYRQGEYSNLIGLYFS